MDWSGVELYHCIKVVIILRKIEKRNKKRIHKCVRSRMADFTTVDRRSAVIFDADSGLYLSSAQILGPKRNLDHRSFFSLGRNVTEFIQIISFFERSSFKLRCETITGILCCCHQACCLLYCLGEINSGIHVYQFTFEPLHFCFRMRMWLWFRIWTKILAIRRIRRKKGTDRCICIPLFTSIHNS